MHIYTVGSMRAESVCDCEESPPDHLTSCNVISMHGQHMMKKTRTVSVHIYRLVC